MRSVRRRIGIAVVLCSSFMFAQGSLELSAGKEKQAGRLYTAYNVWIENPAKVWSTNYKKGYILPAGTEIKKVKHNRKVVQFTVVETGVEVTIVFVAKHHPGLSSAEIRERLVTDKNFDVLTSGFSEQELEAIENGEYEVGMSKEAVLVSLGYPPEIQTPSTKHDRWKYWAHRFNTFDVRFDDDGRVEAVVE